MSNNNYSLHRVTVDGEPVYLSSRTCSTEQVMRMADMYRVSGEVRVFRLDYVVPGNRRVATMVKETRVA